MIPVVKKLKSVGHYESHMSVAYKVVPDILMPMTTDGKLKLNCGAYMLQNVGNSPVCLDGKWTIMPGGTLSLGVGQDHVIIDKLFDVTFKEPCVENKCYDGNRLEIMELCARPCLCPVENIIQ